MSILELLVLLIVAGICGAIAELVVGFSPGGFVVSIVVGVIGAYLGTAVATYLNLPPFLPIGSGPTIDVMWAILGSILLLLVISLLRGLSRRRRGRLL